jgi:hypothetical protein
MVGPHVRQRAGGSLGPEVGKVDQWLRDDPAFQVMTVDGLAWICPFTATVIPAPFGFRQPAREWLAKQRPWQNGQAMSLNEVQVRRWENWLKAALPKPENEWLRWFLPDGRWLNPFTGEFVGGVLREGGRITRETVRTMASLLRGCPQAQGGQPLAREVLQSRLREAMPPTPPSPSGRQQALSAAPVQRAPVATPTPTTGNGTAERIVHGYKIIDQLGEGAMGTVYKAVQISLQRQVALKVIPQVEGGDRTRVERFLREARAAARINHPNVVACYDVGEAGQRLYMAMELVTGGDAETLARANGGALDEGRALEIARDCAAGIEGCGTEAPHQ